jgi:hypothetical protein
MLRAAYAFVALTFAATMPQPVAGQCYGPECNRYRSGPPANFDERPAQHPNWTNHRQSFHPAPHDRGRPYPPTPYAQPNIQQPPPEFQPPPNWQRAQPNFRQPQPNFQQSQPNFQRAQPNFQHAPPNFQQPPQSFRQARPNFQPPGHQAQPRPPIGYAGRPAGVAPPQHYRQSHPDGRIEHRVHVTKKPTVTRHAVRRHQPAPNGRQPIGRQAARDASAPAGAGQVTISVAEYRHLQNQARELQRLMSGRPGAPGRTAVFPDVPAPPPAGKPTL